jgi:methylated-DNA-[protein]-cysteine S-methyltransferase
MKCCRQIPYGRSVSYRELAAAAGRARAARAVGNTMAAKPLAVIVPCHRVTHSGGDGPSARGSCAMRARLRLLESSGVAPVRRKSKARAR